jgi:hypothetical protein
MKPALLTLLPLLAGLAQAQSSTPAVVDDLPGAWKARGAYGDQGYSCALEAWAVDTGADAPAAERVSLAFAWQPSGLALSLRGPSLGKPQVRIEGVGTEHVWDVALEQRRLPVTPADAETLVADIGAGRAVALTLTYKRDPARRLVVDSRNYRVAVPMYRACVEEAAKGVPESSEAVGEEIFQLTSPGGCGLRQWYAFDKYPVSLTLWAARDRGEFAVNRTQIAASTIGIRGTSREPDLVDAAAVFGGAFELTDERRHALSLDQVNGIVADLLRGGERTLRLTEPNGRTVALRFGGAHAKPSAAMLGACRRAQFGG